MTKRPVQVYLDARDRKVLDRLAGRTGLSRAETIREALRRWAAEGEEDRLLDLVGSMDAPGLPADLSTRHDAYAVTGYLKRRVAEPPAPGGSD